MSIAMWERQSVLGTVKPGDMILVKPVVADLTLDKVMLQDVVQKKF